MSVNELAGHGQSNQLQKILNSVRNALTATELDSVLYAVIEGVCEMLGSDSTAAITLIGEQGRLAPDTYRVFGPLAEILKYEKPREEKGIGSWVIVNGQPIFEDDVAAQESPVHPPIRQTLLQPGAYACLPLRNEQQVLGTLFVTFEQPHLFDEGTQKNLESFAALAARAVELFQLREKSERQHSEQIELVRQISQRLLHTWQQTDPINALDKTLDEILRQVDEQVISDQEISAIIYIYDEDLGFYSGAARGPLEDYLKRYPPREGGTAEYVIRQKEPLFISDVTKMPVTLPPLSEYALEQGIKSIANLPLLIGEGEEENIVGILIINLQQLHNFDTNQQAILRLFADQAAIVLQNARVHRRHLREQEALRQISKAASRGRPGEVEHVIVTQVLETTRAAYTALWTTKVERDQLELKAIGSANQRWVPLSSSLSLDVLDINAHVAKTGIEYYTSNLNTDNCHADQNQEMKAAFCVPLIVGPKLLGTLHIATQKENHISQANQEFIRKLAPQAAVTLQNTYLLAQEHYLRQRAEAMQAIVAELRTTFDLQRIGSVILEQIQRVIPYQTASFQRIYPDGQRELFAGKGFDVGSADPFYIRPLSEDAVVDQIVKSGLPKIIPDVSKNEDWTQTLKSVKSWAGLPLSVDNEVLGLLTLDHGEAGFYTEQEHMDLLKTFANHAALALRNARDLNVLNNMAKELPKQSEQAIYELAVKTTRHLFLYDRCIVFSFDKQRGALVARHWFPVDDSGIREFGRGQGLAGKVAVEGNAILVKNTKQDEQFEPGTTSTPRSMMLVPIAADGEVIGVLSVDKDGPDAFDEYKLDILENLALNVGIALNLRKQQDRLQAIAYFQQSISDILSVEEQLRQTYDQMSGLMDTSGMFIALRDEHTATLDFPLVYERGQLITDTLGRQKRRKDISQSNNLTTLTEWVILHRQSLLIDNFVDWLKRENIAEVGAEALMSCLLVPMFVKDKSTQENKIIGVIGLRNFDQPGVFDRNDHELLNTIAGQAAIAIDNARLYDHIENQLIRRVEELEALSKFQEQISDLDTFQDQLQEIYVAAKNVMADVMDFTTMFIALFNEQTYMIEFALVYENGNPPENWEPYEPRHITERRGLTEWVIRHKKALLIEKDFDDWIDKKDDIEAFKIETKCWLGAPMLHGGRVVGVIGLQNFEREGVFDENHRKLLETLARQAAIAIDNAQKYDQIDQNLRRRKQELEAVSKFQHKIINIRSEKSTG